MLSQRRGMNCDVHLQDSPQGATLQEKKQIYCSAKGER